MRDRSSPGRQTGGMAEPGPHLAARIEDAVRAFRERRGRRRGDLATVVPYPGYGGPGWVRVLGRVVLRHPGEPPADPLAGIRGWRSFTTVPVGDVEVTVEAGGERHVIRADRGGVLDQRVAADLAPGWHDIRFEVDGGSSVARILVVDPAVRFGLVSDVDDTVMVTALPRPLLAAWNTFVLDEHARIAVAGMSVLYDRIARSHPGAPVVYLSTGPWNVAPTLTRFLGRNLYPPGPLLLTDWGPTPDRWFRNGAQHKRDSLRRLAEEFPGIRWLLVGDDGQADERLYGEFAASHPGNVAAVAIRRLTPGQAVLAGGRSGGAEVDADVPWISASDGAGLDEQLARIGVLPPDPGRSSRPASLAG
jgi:phosphatidate phosphatase APP1